MLRVASKHSVTLDDDTHSRGLPIATLNESHADAAGAAAGVELVDAPSLRLDWQRAR
jgi:hypothetical protein